MEPEGGKNGKPAVLYLHGIAQTRGYQHRVGLYEKLLEMGHSVLAIDYRGFADSTDLKDITETTVVEDAATSLRYLRSVQDEHSQSDTGEIRSVLSPLWGRSKRDSVARSRRQGLGLLPTEEENGELLQKVSLSAKSAHPYCLFSRNNRYFEKISVWLRLN